jgi:ionotropic glutamate receptor NMDA 1
VVSHPLTGDLSPAAVSYTSGFYHIPVIGISSRDSAFSDKVFSLLLLLNVITHSKFSTLIHYISPPSSLDYCMFQ